MAVPSSDQIFQAIGKFDDHNAYPENEAVITADIPSATLTSLGQILDEAREEVKVSESRKLACGRLDANERLLCHNRQVFASSAD
jgi:hypothetical protein